jgi:hypothetical protein
MTDQIKQVSEALKSARMAKIERPLSECYTDMAQAAIDVLQGWQPIETAPKDERVLLFCPELSATNKQRIELDAAYSTKGRYAHSWATHWLPLPQPPNQACDALAKANGAQS